MRKTRFNRLRKSASIAVPLSPSLSSAPSLPSWPIPVILSEAKDLALLLKVNLAKDLALRIFMAIADSSSSRKAGTPKNDNPTDFSAAC
jgi:hypothetical protein